METGFRNVVILITTLISTYLMPISVSFGVYLALFFVKSRTGRNRVHQQIQSVSGSVESQNRESFPEQQSVSGEGSGGSGEAFSGSGSSEKTPKPDMQQRDGGARYSVGGFDDDNDDDAERVLQAQAEERRQAEIRAAKRSIETNLILVVVFFVVYGAFVVMSSDLRQNYSLFAFSTLKGLLPITTTIANFGTIHSVLLQYWSFFKASLNCRNCGSCGS